MKTIIHVNRHVIAANKKRGRVDPPLTVKNYRETNYGHNVHIDGPSVLVYRPEKPLSCGATVWVETEAGVRIR